MDAAFEIAKDEAIQQLQCGAHHDPGILLGKHNVGTQCVVRSLVPDAISVAIVEAEVEMKRMGNSDVFEWRGSETLIARHFQIEWQDISGQTHRCYEPYCFPVQIQSMDLFLFAEGTHQQAHQFLGAHCIAVDGIHGVLFAVWAPNAERVSIIGNFNLWDGRRHPMRNRGRSGVWELFIPGVEAGAVYKFEIRMRNTGEILTKSDPYGRQFEARPATASVVTAGNKFDWSDACWMEARNNGDFMHTPMSIYELHLGSWKRTEYGEFLNYRDIAKQLVPYVKELGFTHIELLPVSEHPLDASWGYQTTGFFAPTSRFGTAEDFRFFVDYCHQHHIAVILDWVAGHFPRDEHGLANFDGTALYEHADPRRGEHREWGTMAFNYGRHEVRSFLISNALYWIKEFHLDGLRVDAVASMLYLDYGREDDDWLPNVHGGNENLEAVSFLRELNDKLLSQHHGALMIAEESTAWPEVTRPSWLGGLGFSMKWNMGWMHDSLNYMRKDPVHRHYHHDNLTFGLLYSFHENFVLPFSHDEVVHGKGAMLAKMPGDEWQRFANLRLLYTYMFTYPGKKLLFMGGEIGQWQEWDHDKSLDWELLNYPRHQGIRTLISDLNRLYVSYPALYFHDFEERGFEWIDCHDASQSVISYLRKHDDRDLIIVLNFTPVPRYGYRLGVKHPGSYRELLNSDSAYYTGSNLGNAGEIHAQAKSWMGQPFSIELLLPPLAGLVLEHVD